jgi:ketosteroid isomerase-like protein
LYRLNGSRNASTRDTRGLRKLASAWADNFEEYRLDLERLIDIGDGEVLVLAYQRGLIKGSDVGIEHRVGFEWLLRDGKIARVRVHFSWEEALGAAGLSEQGDQM